VIVGGISKKKYGSEIFLLVIKNDKIATEKNPNTTTIIRINLQH
jgi:hypothetical protein